MTSGDIVGGMTRVLAEERTLAQLVAWVEAHGEGMAERSPTARIATATSNTLLFANRLEAHRTLLDAGLRAAAVMGDSAGEANCLQRLGDLAMRVDDLEVARQQYEQALPLYREIRDRLGEANCLQSLGLLALISGQLQAAFQRFLDVLQRFRALEAQVGQQAAHGYLARAAAAAGALDQALVLAEASLDIGRRIRDRFGQRINLELQMQILAQQGEELPALATVRLLRDLCQSLGDDDAASRCSEILESARNVAPEEIWSVLDPEMQRQGAVAAARERLQAQGRSLYDPPQTPEPT